MNWLGLNFVNSAMVAGGVALIASPIIIHLINRLRYRRVRFAAMEFLLESQQRNRRRILIEQLLLLLLRILIVLGLVGLIARLVLDPSQMSLLTGSKVHHVVLLDDSGSMWDSWEQEERGGDVKRVTAFSEGLAVIRKLAAEGERRPGSQQMTILLLSQLEQPLVSQEDVNEAFLGALKAKLDNLESSYQSLELGDGLDASRKLLTEELTGVRHLHVISDFREQDWSDSAVLREAVEALNEADVSVNLVKTVSERRANLGITDLSGDLHVAAAGIPLRLQVTVRNFGDTDVKSVPLTVQIDGETIPKTFEVEAVPAGGEVSRPIDVYPDTPGLHEIVISLPGDSYPQDDSRFVAVNVPAQHQVLIIDGSEDRFGSEYVKIALSREESGFEPVVQSPDFLRRNPLDEFASIFMLNVAALEPDAVKPLEDFVRGGGGLAWFVGPRVQSGFYNAALYGCRTPEDRPRLFPAPLASGARELRHDLGLDAGPDVQLVQHPIFAKMFQGQTNPFTLVMRVDQYFAVDRSFQFVDETGQPLVDDDGRRMLRSPDDNIRSDGVRTIGQLRTGDPLFFEHSFGDGRIVTCLSSAGPVWNNWSLREGGPGFVVMLLELQRRIARTDHVPISRVVGESVRFSFDPAVYEAEAEFATPDEDAGRRKLVLRYAGADGKPVADESGESESETPEADGDGEDEGEAGDAESAEDDGAGADATPERLVQTVGEDGETGLPGVYRFSFPTQQGEVDQRWIAFNVPAAEGSLALASDEEIRERLGAGVDVRLLGSDDLSWLEGKEVGDDVREALLIGLLILLLLEQLLAWRLSYHPEPMTKLAGATR